MATLPLADGSAGSLNGTATTNAQQKTNFVNLRTFLSDLLGTDSSNKLAARVALGVTAAIQGQTDTAFTTTGTSTAYVLTPTTVIAVYAANQRFTATFHTSSGATPTINVSGLGAKSLKQYDSTGTKVAATVYANQITDIVYDGTDFIVKDPAPPSTNSSRQIQPIDATVASNALTVSLAPTALDFRSATLTDGTVNSRVIGSTLSLTVPSTATLGTISGQPARLVILALDNVGTVELAICNLSGTSLDETTLITTTAISTGSTSNSVIYSASARTSVPFRIVGFIDSTQATAGTWATVPAQKQGAGGDALKHVGQFQSATLATTSGTSLDVTGIPDWVNRITLILNGVTMTGTLQLQIGAGAIVSSGYNYTQKTFTATAVAVAGSTSAANWPIQTVSGAKSGTVVLNRSPGTNRWTAVYDVAVDGSTSETELLGFLTLAGTLDRLRLSSSNTAFSAGSMSVIWE